MPTISPSLPSDGDDAIVEPYNAAIIAILGLINGGLDSDNIDHFSGSLIDDNSITDDKFADDARTGWNVTDNPSSCSALGNRNYNIVVNSTDLTDKISKGMRLRLTRGSAAPLKCATLNGSTQFFNKTSPNKLTFTDDFVNSIWVKIPVYQAEAMIARYNGTSGFEFFVDATGRVSLTGFNASSSNFSQVKSRQGIPLNRWVHLAAQLDMSTFTATTTTSYIMIDGVDVQADVIRGGTNPTALVQAGNLEIGSENGGTSPFNGQIAQAAIYNAKVTQATILASMQQGLVGTETSLASGYSFNNAITDLNTTTPNDLSPQGSAVATTADNPFSDSTGTLGYAIVLNAVFSTNTTLNVQVPEGFTLPSSLSAMAFSTDYIPYKFPAASKFKLSAYDTGGALTNVLIPLIVQYVVNNPIENLPYLNVGTGGGTMYLTAEGSTRKIALSIAGASATTTYSNTFPGSFLTTAEIITQGVMGSGASTTGQYVVTGSLSATGFSWFSGTNPNAGTGFLVIGT